MSAYTAELKAVLRALRSRGLDVVQARKHYAVRKDGRFICSISVSPSDGNWRRQVERDLRRAGALAQGEQLLGRR